MSSVTAPGGGAKLGSLIIAGSGVSGVAHMTLETDSHLKAADRVFYLVSDPATEAYIQENNRNTHDLSVFYDEGKPVYQSYVEMTEAMLNEVRAGHNVLGILHGHPGVFVSPAQMALTSARQEGYKARMLPGISAEDYMFAELEFEPTQYGCMTSEATELLARDRPLNPSVHNIIWRIGLVGGPTPEDQRNSKFQLLVDRLERDFGGDHKVVHYVGATIPQSSSAMVVFSISDLRNEQLAQQFNSISSLYIPPRTVDPVQAAIADALKLSNASQGRLSASPQWVAPRFVVATDYDPFDRPVANQVDQRVVPGGGRKSLRASPAMRKFMIDLALQPRLQEAYKENPSAVVEGVPGLTDRERFALRLGRDSPVFAVMLRSSDEEPTEEQLDAALSPGSLKICMMPPVAY